MKRILCGVAACGFFLGSTMWAHAGETRFLTNHLGYEVSGPKHAVVLGKAGDKVAGCVLEDNTTDRDVLSLDAKAAGPPRIAEQSCVGLSRSVVSS